MSTENVRGGPAVGHEGSPEADERLLPYLRAATEAEAERQLAQVISEHTGPVVDEVLRRKLGPADAAQAEDLRGDVILELLARLRAAKERPHEAAIHDLRGYVAVAAAHACHGHLRRKYPRRHSLKNKLRYLLTHQRGLALWQSDGGEQLAGFAAWVAGRARARGERVEAVRSDPAACVPPSALSEEARRERPAESVAALLDYLGGPVELDELVDAVARLWGVADLGGAHDTAAAERAPDVAAGAEAELEARDYLRRLWVEIKGLPTRQRAALLLNLKDDGGRGCIALLPLAGVASVRQIAAALEMTAEQLAGLWSRLPLDDVAIAARLNLTRQQVINLRKSARARLARRAREFG